MKFYYDKNLTQELSDKDYIGEAKAGEPKEFTIYIKNDSEAYWRNINIEIESSEKVEVIKSPIELGAQMSDELILKWSPSVDLKKGLKFNIKVNKETVWG